jgi:hypothetical protein
MSNEAAGTGIVSWEVFNDLYESQYDLLRKLRFFIKAGRSDRNEKLALDLIDDFLAGKEDELEALRQRGLEEWKVAQSGTGAPPCSDSPFSRKAPDKADRSLNLPEDICQDETPPRNGFKPNGRNGK